jgi:hypothetical protein
VSKYDWARRIITDLNPEKVSLIDVGQYIAIKYVNMLAGTNEDAKIIKFLQGDNYGKNGKYTPGKRYVENKNYVKNRDKLGTKIEVIKKSIAKAERLADDTY